MNLRIQLAELEDQIAECHEEREQQLQETRVELERALQDQRERVRLLQQEADHARQLVSRGSEELSLVEATTRLELSDLTRRHEIVLAELESKTNALDTANESNLQQLMRINSLQHEFEALQTSNAALVREFDEQTHALDASAAHVERAQAALVAVETEALRKAAQMESELTALQDALQSAGEQRHALEGEASEQMAELRVALQTAERDLEALRVQSGRATTEVSALDAALSDWKAQCQSLQSQLESSSNEMRLLEQTQRIAQDAAARKEKELYAEAAHLLEELDAVSAKNALLEQSVQVAHGDLAVAQERIAAYEREIKDRSDDCTLLVQQLAESELRVEELEKTVSRVRSERDDLALLRDELQAKATALDAECRKFSVAARAREEEAAKDKTVTEDAIGDLRRAVQSEKDANESLAHELRSVRGQMTSLEAALSSTSAARDAAALQWNQDKVWNTYTRT
jgi:chromosome segregation ATPase